MKSRRVLTLKYWLPLLVTGLFALLWGALAFEEFNEVRLYLLENSQNLVRREMAALQREVEVELRHGDLADIQSQIASMGVDEHFKVLTMIDDQGRIRYATRFAWKGRLAKAMLPEYEPQKFTAVRRSLKSELSLDEASLQIHAYWPFMLDRESTELRSGKVGVLFAVYDLSVEAENLWNLVWRLHYLSWGLLALILLALIFFIQRFVNLPIKRLISLANNISAGKLNVRSNFTGKGEFAYLGRTFDTMCAELQDRLLRRRQAETLLRESEEKYRAIFNSDLASTVVMVDGKGKIVDWNPGAERTTGYTKSEALDMPLTNIIPQRYRERHLKEFNRAVALGKASFPNRSHELYGLRKNGQEFPILLSLGSLHSAGSVFFCALIVDMTDRKQFEKILRQGQKMAAIGELSGGIAHDFNNLLGIMLGNVTLLQQSVSVMADKVVAKRLASIEKSIRRATDLTQRLLGFAGKHAEHKVTVDAGRLLKGSRDLIHRTMTMNIDVKFELHENLCLVDIDPGDFEDALLNLLINARDAMPGGGQLSLTAQTITITEEATVHCTPDRALSPGDYLQLEVSDTGLGIQPDHLERVFEPFFTTKTPGQGTGLGLAMVFGFVKRSGGHVDVFSKPGCGTTFTLFLPRSDTAHETAGVEPGMAAPLPGGSETLLVVDDEVDLLEPACESLSALGYQVLAASNGRQALQCIRQNSAIKLLFSDVVLSDGLNGYELAEQARALKPALKVLLASGYTGRVNADAARLDDELLSKPYTLRQLALRIRELLDREPVQAVDPPVPEAVRSVPGAKQFACPENFNIGVEALDDDHTALLHLVNGLCQIPVADGGSERMSQSLDQLLNLIKAHFRKEETIMAVCAYPGLMNHRKVHQLQLRQFQQLRLQLAQGDVEISTLTPFFNDWLVEHIQIMDAAIAPYCEGKEDLIARSLHNELSGDITTP